MDWLKPLPPGKALVRQTKLSFTRLHEVLDLVNMVDVQRAKVENVLGNGVCHLRFLSIEEHLQLGFRCSEYFGEKYTTGAIA